MSETNPFESQETSVVVWGNIAIVHPVRRLSPENQTRFGAYCENMRRKGEYTLSGNYTFSQAFLLARELAKDGCPYAVYFQDEEGPKRVSGAFIVSGCH